MSKSSFQKNFSKLGWVLITVDDGGGGGGGGVKIAKILIT